MDKEKDRYSDRGRVIETKSHCQTDRNRKTDRETLTEADRR